MEGQRSKLFSKKTVFSIVVFCVVIAVVLLNLNVFNIEHQQLAHAAGWYDYSWNYRQKITITNAGSELTDYQVFINDSQLDGTSVYSRAKEDGSDIRFTSSNGTTLINHWTKSFSAAGQTAEIWVKVPTIAASTTTDIYLYAGNADAGSTSSGPNTFVFFDDFETYASTADMLASNWTDASINGAFVVYSSNGGYGSSKGMLIDPNGGTGWRIPVAYSQSTFSTGNILEFDAKTANANFSAGSRFGLSNATTPGTPDSGGTNFASLEQNNNFSTSKDGVTTTNAVSGLTITDWNSYKITWGSDSKLYANGTLKATNATNVPTVNLRARFIVFPGGVDFAQKGYVDNVKVRKLAATEPTAVANGSEEVGDSTAPTNPAVTAGYNSSGKTVNLVSGNWASFPAPYFEFSGSIDSESGVKGYYVYFGDQSGADPFTTGVYQAHVGVVGAVQNYTSGISLSTGSTYYLRVKTKNNAGLISSAQTLFTYSFDNVSPAAPEYVNISPVGCSSGATFTPSWPVASDTGGSGIAGYQYKNGSSGAISLTTNLTVDVPSYQEGDNVFYVRSIDNAGNTSSWQTVVYCSTATAQVTDGPTITAGPSSITVAWISNKATTSYVQVYDGNTYVSEQGQTSFVLTHNVKIIGLESEKAYRYKLVWTDSSGNLGESAWYETNTSTTPRVLNLKAESLSSTKVLVSWQTNYSAQSSLKYGIGAYDRSINLEGSASNFSYQLENLVAGSGYQLGVDATTADGSKFAAGINFSTPPLPLVESLHFEQVTNEASAAMRVIWSTNVETTSSVFYGAKGEVKKEISKSDMAKEHEIKITDLSDNTTYEVYVTGIDQYGNVARSSISTFQTAYDTRPPTISGVVIETSNVGLGQKDSAQIAVSWKTDEPTTSQVEYDIGISGTEYTKKTTEDATLTNSHLVIVSGLTPGIPYHIRAASKDRAGNAAYSSDNTIISGEVSKSTLQIILKVLNSTFGWIGKLFQ